MRADQQHGEHRAVLAVADGAAAGTAPAQDLWDKMIELRMVQALDACCVLPGDADDSLTRELGRCASSRTRVRPSPRRVGEQ
ncbi:hypothetical protein, partial [Kitasatospora sp. NPDC059327]|uniref:hypothetical protein n=1 Tax=Kitasatospora sp. NPDC059327 TaxID=3346803 RepID=UPI0036B9C11E